MPIPFNFMNKAIVNTTTGGVIKELDTAEQLARLAGGYSSIVRSMRDPGWAGRSLMERPTGTRPRGLPGTPPIQPSGLDINELLRYGMGAQELMRQYGMQEFGAQTRVPQWQLGQAQMLSMVRAGLESKTSHYAMRDVQMFTGEYIQAFRRAAATTQGELGELGKHESLLRNIMGGATPTQALTPANIAALWEAPPANVSTYAEAAAQFQAEGSFGGRMSAVQAKIAERTSWMEQLDLESPTSAATRGLTELQGTQREVAEAMGIRARMGLEAEGVRWQKAAPEVEASISKLPDAIKQAKDAFEDVGKVLSEKTKVSILEFNASIGDVQKRISSAQRTLGERRDDVAERVGVLQWEIEEGRHYGTTNPLGSTAAEVEDQRNIRRAEWRQQVGGLSDISQAKEQLREGWIQAEQAQDALSPQLRRIRRSEQIAATTQHLLWAPWQFQMVEQFGQQQAQQAMAYTGQVGVSQAGIAALGGQALTWAGTEISKRQANAEWATYYQGQGAAAGFGGLTGIINQIQVDRPDIGRAIGYASPLGTMGAYAAVSDLYMRQLGQSRTGLFFGQSSYLSQAVGGFSSWVTQPGGVIAPTAAGPAVGPVAATGIGLGIVGTALFGFGAAMQALSPERDPYSEYMAMYGGGKPETVDPMAAAAQALSGAGFKGTMGTEQVAQSRLVGAQLGLNQDRWARVQTNLEQFGKITGAGPVGAMQIVSQELGQLGMGGEPGAKLFEQVSRKIGQTRPEDSHMVGQTMNYFMQSMAQRLAASPNPQAVLEKADQYWDRAKNAVAGGVTEREWQRSIPRIDTPMEYGKVMSTIGAMQFSPVDRFGRPAYYEQAHEINVLQRDFSQQMQGFELSGQAAELSRQRAAIGRQRGYEDWARPIQQRDQLWGADYGIRQVGLSIQQMEYGLNQGYAGQQRSNQLQRQLFEMNVQWQQSDIVTQGYRAGIQHEWQREDMAVQRNTFELQQGWNLEDINEAIRYASGRDRIKLTRQRDRLSTMTNIQRGTMDRAEERAETQYGWSEEDRRKALDRLEKETSIRREMLNISDEQQKNERNFARQQLALMREQEEHMKTARANLEEQQRRENILYTAARKDEDARLSFADERLKKETDFYEKVTPLQTELNKLMDDYQNNMVLMQLAQQGYWKEFEEFSKKIGAGGEIYQRYKEFAELGKTVSSGELGFQQWIERAAR